MNLAQPMRKRQLGSITQPFERVEHPGAVLALHEHVDVLRLSRNPGVVRKGKRAADEKRNASLLKLAQRIDIEIGSWIVQGSCGGGFHETPQDATLSVARLTCAGEVPRSGVAGLPGTAVELAGCGSPARRSGAGTSNTRNGARSGKERVNNGIETL